MDTLKKLQAYMRGRRALLPGALILSAVSALLGMLPYICLWLIARELFTGRTDVSQSSIEVYAWWAAGLSITGIITYFLALMLSHLAAFRVETEMRRRAMEKIVRLPLGFFDTNASGKIRKIIDDNASITHTFLAHQLPDLAGTAVMPLATVGLLLFFDWRLGLACLVPILLAMALMTTMMGKKGRYFMNAYMSSLEEMNTEAVEYVRGIPVVKVFQQTVFSFKNFHDSIERYKNMVIEYTLMWENPMSAYTVIIHGIAYALVPAAILLIGRTADPTSVLLNLIFYVLITPVFSQNIMRSMYLSQALGQASEAVDRTEALTNSESLPESESPRIPESYDINYKDVSFSYPGSENKAVDGVSFTIPEGRRYALVGASGGGKTTLARMLPRFWDVDEGRIMIGGVDVKEISGDYLMNRISFVFQNNRLFKTTLRENLLYGKSDAGEAELERALDLAQCREIIDRLPEGLETKIGKDGSYLSGGEQQRIALARAILKDAPIVVLDEATAFADPENEDLIHKALKMLSRGKTVLMIAHRLTSVMDADSILVIDKGRIAEQGNHRELLDRNGIYARMWKEYQESVRWTVTSYENEREPQYV